MDITKTKLSGGDRALLEKAMSKAESVQAEIDLKLEEFNTKALELEAIKKEIRPLKAKASEVAQVQASIASRKSRAKYFPEFATRNYQADEEKDSAFNAIAEESLK